MACIERRNLNAGLFLLILSDWKLNRETFQPEEAKVKTIIPVVKIIVATHKKYQMPEDTMYLPVQVGAEGRPDLGYVRDNTGDNISLKKSKFL